MHLKANKLVVIITVRVRVIAAVIVNAMDWILASNSPRRKELLSSLGLVFKCANAEVEEVNVDFHPQPEIIAQNNAQKKAEYVANLYPNSYIIGADTIVTLEGKIFYKPKDMIEAKRMLQQLSGKQHTVVTGVSVVCKAEKFLKNFFDVTWVYFKPLTDDFIDEYFKTVYPLDKSGAYAIQEPLTQTFARISGSESNVVGFPVEKFSELILKSNF